MRRTKNPFSIRRSEAIDSIPTFLNLFEPGILEVLSPEWETQVTIIRSARGGGKTSLLRLFTPDVLRNLHQRRTDESLKDLLKALSQINAIGESGPAVLGVMLMCGRNFSNLEELRVNEVARQRLFYALLNVRIVLATLRAAAQYVAIEFPGQLHQIDIGTLPSDANLNGLNLPCSGKELFSWASDLEQRICNSLDGFGPVEVDHLPGHDSLDSLLLIRPETLLFRGQPIAPRTLLMMDDIHKLTGTQREKLVKSAIELRSPIGVWIAERYEGLSTPEILASGAAENRDVRPSVGLEQYWRRHFKQFEKHSLKIADKRIRAFTTDSDDFRSCLSAGLESPEFSTRLESACDVLNLRLDQQVQLEPKYAGWLQVVRQESGTAWKRARNLKRLEIIIARQERKRQGSLFDDESLPVDIFENQIDSSLSDAAELFLAREFSIPYYFGPERVARLASLNIQQFLSISSPLFEDVMSASLLGQQVTLSPERQHKRLKEEAKRLWDEIPKSVEHGREVRNLIEGIGRFAQDYTYRPSAPNDPGVGGAAIKMSERGLLMECHRNRMSTIYTPLANALSSAIAHNLIVADLDSSCKNERWMVLNLNRLLCVHYDLPLGYGLFKEQPLGTLLRWIDRPYTTKKGTLFK